MQFLLDSEAAVSVIRYYETLDRYYQQQTTKASTAAALINYMCSVHAVPSISYFELVGHKKGIPLHPLLHNSICNLSLFHAACIKQSVVILSNLSESLSRGTTKNLNVIN